MLSLALSAMALQAQVTPVVQHVTITQGKTLADVSSFRLTGADKADPQSVALLRSSLPIKSKGAVEIIIGEKGDKAVKPFADKIPATPEGYYLNIQAPDKIIIAGADERGTFYGVQTLLQTLRRHPVRAQEITDYPSMASRGVIEGFYGNPWSHTDRLSQFDFYGRHKMNVYVYGPKDDPYHHSRWYEPYPADKAEQMKELTQAAAKNKVKFVWAMHPSNSIETPEQRTQALRKFEQMYGLGVRNFAIFFDDISAKSVDTQIDYLNFLDREFVKKHSDVGPLVVCPTIYNRAWNSGNYLNKMGTGLNPDIEIMWTGNSVCDFINVEDCQWFTDQTTRKPYIWLNYPVNDYGMHNLLMGPMEGNDVEINNMTAAFCSNPMQYAEASKVALYQIADFAWNGKAFNPQASWEGALAELMPDHIDAFRAFCENNVDVGQSVHGLRLWGETPEFAAMNKCFKAFTPAAIAAYKAWFTWQGQAADELLAVYDTNPLLREVKEWIEAMKCQSRQGLAMIDMAENINQPARFIAAYKTFEAAGEDAEKLISRNFEGSIQRVNVKTGTLHVAPFIKQNSRELINLFKKTGAEYPADLFPEQVLENGAYYIKHNGRWLGNPEAGSKGGAPVFQSEIDDINPNRQEWLIQYDPVNERYSIRNSKDNRYLNEAFKFGVNPYSRDWNTYVIKKDDQGRYSIQNGGNGGNANWGVTGDKITANPNGANNFIFEIIPVID